MTSWTGRVASASQTATRSPSGRVVPRARGLLIVTRGADEKTHRTVPVGRSSRTCMGVSAVRMSRVFKSEWFDLTGATTKHMELSGTLEQPSGLQWSSDVV